MIASSIARWAALKEEFLIGALDLPNGIPRKDVFRRVLMALKPAAFQACYANWLDSLRAKAAAAAGVEQPVLAIDGKTVRLKGSPALGQDSAEVLHNWLGIGADEVEKLRQEGVI